MIDLLSHWHPVLLSRELGRAPKRVDIHGEPIVVFRAGERIGALPERCAHRGMPLSKGTVRDGCVECPYHAWRWDADGNGTVPATPRARPRTEPFDAVERMGAVWVRRRGSEGVFPHGSLHGHALVGRSHHRVRAPLELVLDNFIEVEHTPSVHALLGYPASRMADVVCEVTSGDDWVRVYNRGPQRALPSPIRWLFGLPRDVDFVDDWTVRFSPVHAVYEQYFIRPNSDERLADALRIAVFFTPRSEDETDVIVLSHTSGAPWSNGGVNLLRQAALAALVPFEVSRDKALLESLAGVDLPLRGRTLGRFDKALVLARDRLDRVYRQRA